MPTKLPAASLQSKSALSDHTRPYCRVSLTRCSLISERLGSRARRTFGQGVNGVTIVADAKPEIVSLTLLHIELDTHDAILAEGLAVESFRHDNPHAQAFDNVDEYVRLYGPPGEPPAPFAPILRYRRSRQELASHMRSALAPVYDFRKPIEKVRDRIIDRLARAALIDLNDAARSPRS